MKWKIIALLTAFSAFAIEPFTAPALPKELPDLKVQSQFPYFTLGLGPAPIPFPFFGFGYRYQSGYNGVDVSVKASTVVSVTGVQGTVLYQYYFKPNLSSQFYVGAGPTCGGLIGGGNSHVLLSPEVVFGKQYKNEAGDTRFMQATIDWPTMTYHNHKVHAFAMPIVIFDYGMAF